MVRLITAKWQQRRMSDVGHLTVNKVTNIWHAPLLPTLAQVKHIRGQRPVMLNAVDNILLPPQAFARNTSMISPL
jgi:hypothetical protein